MEGGDGGWRGGERLYLFIFSRGGEGTRNIIILCVFQFMCMFSNSFVCLRKKLKPNSFACLPIHWRGVPPPRTSIIISRKKKAERQFIRTSTNSFVCLPLKKSLNPNSFVCLQIHSYVFQKNPTTTTTNYYHYRYYYQYYYYY